MTETAFTIIGGGIAGLAAALACPAEDVLLLERAETFSEVGAGLQLGPNAVAALRALGAWEAVEAITAVPREIHMRDGLTGKLVKRIALGPDFARRFGAPYRTAHRADLHAALLASVRQHPHVTLRTAAEAQVVAQAPEHVEVACGGSVRILSKAVIAADGVRSATRLALHKDSAPHDSGLVFHRALLDMPRDSGGVAFDCVTLWMVPDGHVVHYPVGRPERLNLVAVTRAGLMPAKAFATACPAVQHLLRMIPDRAPWPGLYVATLNRWHDRRVLLLGDAAHATLPFLAQGAAMALEDAAALCAELARGAAVPRAFAAISARRQPRTRRLHEETLRAGRTYHLGGAMAWARNATLRALPPSVFLHGLNWLYVFQPGRS